MQEPQPNQKQIPVNPFRPTPVLVKRLFLVLPLLFAILCSCRNETLKPTFSPTHTAAPPATSEPTLTPTAIPRDLIFILSNETYPSLSMKIQETIEELSNNAGWKVQQIHNKDTLEIPPNLRLFIALPPDPGIQELALNHPELQFLAIGIPGLVPQQNLSILGPEGFPFDQQAFIAGYTSAVLTKDWRIGMIAEFDSERFQEINKAFTNGVVFYCGLCQLAYPPFHDYPITYQLPQNPSQEDWQNAINFLLSYSTETIFILSSEPNHSVLQNVVDKGILLLGDQDPPQSFQSAWAATVRFAPEDAIRELWEDLGLNTSGWIENIPLIFDNINDDLFSIGRQRWVNETLKDLREGFIETGASNP
jgi:hypothetical protein